MEGTPGPGDAGGAESSANPATVEMDGIEFEIDNEVDDGKVYCFCQKGSYGDMIACDESGCKYEWVSIVFTNLDHVGMVMLMDDRAVPLELCGPQGGAARRLVL